MSVSKQFAIQQFNRTLNHINDGGTPVREVLTFPLNTIDRIKKALQAVGPGVVVWQHTSAYHAVAMHITKGEGFNYSRIMLDLIAKGVTDIDSFEEAWQLTNGDQTRGNFPILGGGSATANSRKKHSSYIIVDQDIPPKEISSIKGELTEMQVDRTHLIPSGVTGIENHKALLIDFDGWLNEVPMNEFEQLMLNKTKQQDIIWIAYVKNNLLSHNITWKYIIMDEQYNIINSREWVDDRWTYIWRFDNYQNDIPS
ncbi:hypothetical protein LMB49_03665 [Limosilactobacillus reuteri]|uniref:hypothetical protein n=1 Tax=Limosilactobacillus reuteri TaxID=1598 RepID=UPI001E4EE513|nr:hypothetical protein [Limosilactobacillus reuteri]MCC4370494.1 hypothetical protein [Limosilactobacillus reuteri]MCC4508242.1 hypothetical protein [Limosilactobacillus reuteri]